MITQYTSIVSSLFNTVKVYGLTDGDSDVPIKCP